MGEENDNEVLREQAMKIINDTGNRAF
jgi:hypothetical protein